MEGCWSPWSLPVAGQEGWLGSAELWAEEQLLGNPVCPVPAALHTGCCCPDLEPQGRPSDLAVPVHVPNPRHLWVALPAFAGVALGVSGSQPAGYPGALGESLGTSSPRSRDEPGPSAMEAANGSVHMGTFSPCHTHTAAPLGSVQLGVSQPFIPLPA